jgi:hypothetical protein
MSEPPPKQPPKKDQAYWGEVHIRADKAPAIQLSGKQFVAGKPRRMFPWLRRKGDA